MYVTERGILKREGRGKVRMKQSINGIITNRIPAVVALGVAHNRKGASASGIGGVARDSPEVIANLGVATPFERSGSATIVVTVLADGSS